MIRMRRSFYGNKIYQNGGMQPMDSIDGQNLEATTGDSNFGIVSNEI